jgi:hypothetical protein
MAKKITTVLVSVDAGWPKTRSSLDLRTEPKVRDPAEGSAVAGRNVRWKVSRKTSLGRQTGSMDARRLISPPWKS